jgi:seryl-tRNA synthetase
MSPFLKTITSRTQLPGVARARAHIADVEKLYSEFKARHAELDAIDADRTTAIEKFNRTPNAQDLENAIAAVIRANSVAQIRSELCNHQSTAVAVIEQDEKAVNDLVTGLQEILGVIENVEEKMVESEQEAASKAGLPYAGTSPTVQSLTSIKSQYSEALATIEKWQDSDGSNRSAFQAFGQLVQ